MTTTNPIDPERILGMDVHAILVRCRNFDAALENIGGAIAARQIDVRADAVWKIVGGVKTITRGNKLDQLWAAIKSIGMEAAVWESSAVSLPASGSQPALDITGIDFDHAHVITFAKRYGLPGMTGGERAVVETRGRPWQRDDWEKFYHALIRIAHAGKLNRATYPTQAALVRELHEQLNERLDYETLRKAVSAIAKEYGLGRS